MNTPLLTVKRSKNSIRVIMAMFICLFVNGAALAQSINITINIVPPYSPYYSDYSGINASKVLVVLQNLTSSQQKIKLVGKLKGDNGVSITTYSNYTPLQPIILNPHEVKQMNGTALKDIFNLNNLSVVGVDKVKLAQSSRIPEGNYNLCLQAVAYDSRAVLSPLAPSGCTFLAIAYPEPPVLVNPSPQSYVYASTPQTVVFSWINPGTVPFGTQYKIEMAQMPDLVNSDPNQVLNAISLPILSQQVSGLSYLYSVQNLGLLPGKRYAWRVTAIDPSGKTEFKNKGVSPASVFTYGTPVTSGSDALFAVFVPNSSQNHERVNEDNDFSLIWNYYHATTGVQDTTVILDNAIYKQLGITQYHVEILPAKASSGKLTDNAFAYNTFINTVTGAAATASLSASFNRTAAQCDSIGLKDQFWYKANIYALDANSNVINEATSVDFQYQHIKDVTTQTVNVSASLKYRFQNYPDVNIAPNIPVEIVALQKLTKPKYGVKPVAAAFQLNTITYNTDQYSILGSATVISDSTGKITTGIIVPKNMDPNNIYYQVNIKDQYYATPVNNIYRDSLNSANPNLGQIMLNVHGYSLKLMVSEFFEYSTPAAASPKNGITYSASKSKSYGQGVSRAKAGIPVILYRKNKKSNIPPVEGQLTTVPAAAANNIEQVGSGLTVVENKPDGTQTSYVKFDKLLCNIYNGDEYYMLAVDSALYSKEAAANAKIFSLKPYTDQHFKATEQAFSYSYTNSLGSQNTYYGNTTGFYSIQSTLPPEATISGKIVYEWQTDPTKTKRPLPNQSFTVRIATPGSSQTQNEAQNSDPVRGVGTTDAQGNFTVKVVVMNLANYGDKLPDGNSYNNPYNSLAKGQNFAPDGSKYVGNPNTQAQVQQLINNSYPAGENGGDFSKLGNLTGQLGMANEIPGNGNVTSIINQVNSVATQNGMNTGSHAVFTGTSDGGFNINIPNLGANAAGANGNFGNGPSADINIDALTDDLPADSLLQSKFYICFDNYPYCANPAQLIDVAAFTTNNVGVLTADVGGGSKTIKVYDDKTKSPIGGMRVLVFAPVNNYPPLGQGDGLGTVGKLINPQLKQTMANTTNVVNVKLVAGAKGAVDEWGNKIGAGNTYMTDTEVTTDQSAMFNSSYSIYWNGLTDSKGQITVPNLVNQNIYYIEATTDPNQDGGSFFEPAIGNTNMDSILVTQLPSRIAGRLIDTTNKSITGTQGIGGELVTVVSNKADVGHSFTDKDGYFEILSSKLDTTKINTKADLNFTLRIDAPGYKTVDATIGGTISLQGQQFNKVIAMVPNGALPVTVYTTDNASKKKTPVKAYLQRNDGSVFQTDGNGKINVPMVGNGDQKIMVIPVDPGYFTETETVTLGDINKSTPQSYLVLRRKHRFHFMATDANSNQPLANAKIYIDAKSSITTNTLGVADTSFENVSVNNYTFQIYGAGGSGYIPQTVNAIDTESKAPVTFKIKLQRGGIVKGTVTLDGKPVRYAKIYANIKMQAQQPIGVIGKDVAGGNDPTLVQAYTDQNGNYTLFGLPVINGPVDLIATLDTSFTVSGDERTVTMAASGGQQNFALASYKNMVINNLFGFPLTVESIAAGSDNNHAIVTGTINLTKATSDFSLLPGNKIVRVRSVNFAAATDATGHRFGSPVNDNIPLEGVASLKFRYLDKYNVQVDIATGATTNPGNSSGINGLQKAAPAYQSNNMQINELMITKTAENKGVIKGKIHIVDNSFNYPSTYLSFKDGADNLYLADASSGQLTTSIAAITASYSGNDGVFFTKNYSPASTIATTLISNKKFNLCSASGDSVLLKFINFNSTADPINSYIQKDGKINLAINMKCHIANATPENISVKINNIILDGDAINVTTGQQPIQVKLEKWNLLIKNWMLSPTDGGITSTNGLVQTGAVDIPFSRFNLRSDMFVIDGFSLDNLQLGGGLKTLSMVNVNNASLEFDQAVGSDHGAHWKFAIAGDKSTPAAEIDNLPSLNGPVTLSYLQMISNGESILTLQENNTPLIVNNNKLALFSPQGIVSGPGFFDIVGALTIKAPRFAPMSLGLHYSLVNGLLSASYKSVAEDFEGKGYVHFTAANVDNNISITPDSLVIKGFVSEQPSKTFETMPALFVANPNSAQPYKVLLDTLTIEPVVNGTYNLKLHSGGMKVIGNDWDILRFTGKLNEVPSSSAGKSFLGDNSLTFNVLGDVQISGSSIGTSSNVPGFGKFDLTFDFTKPALHGSINIDKQQMDGFTVGGALEMEFDKNGFYIGGSVIGGAPIPIPLFNELLNGQVKLGFLVGSYPIADNDAIWGEVTQYQVVKNRCWLSSLGNRLTGFYYALGAQLNFGKEIDLGVADVGFTASLGYDISMGLDFNKGLGNPRFVTMYDIYGQADAGLASYLTGTAVDFSIGINAALLGAATFDIPSAKLTGLTLAGALDISGRMLIRQSLIFKTVTLLDVQENLMINADTGSGLSFRFYSGNPQQPCLPFK